MPASTRMRTSSASPWLVLLIGAAAFAGPISPPPGPVSPTGKTIGESEPRVLISALPVTISVSGSYYLGGDLEGTGGITIAASDVTIDMAGFSVDAGPGAVGDGIASVGSVTNISVFNGSISGWPGDGVDLSSASNCLLTDLTSNNNTLDGFVLGAKSTMVRCTASGNGGSGIGGSDSGKVSHSTASENGAHGVSLGDGATIESSEASGNGGDGFSVGEGSTISLSTGSRNKFGFRVGAGGLVVDSAAIGNDGDGFIVDSAVQVRACNATGNTGTGIRAGRSATVMDCTSGANGLNGILLGHGAVARGNAVRDNDEHGVAVEDGTVGAIVERNQAFNNKGVGFFVQGIRCLTFSNAASANGNDYQLRGDGSFGAITDVAGDGAFSLTNSYANLRY